MLCVWCMMDSVELHTSTLQMSNASNPVPIKLAVSTSGAAAAGSDDSPVTVGKTTEDEHESSHYATQGMCMVHTTDRRTRYFQSSTEND